MWKETSLSKALEQKTAKFPPPAAFPGDKTNNKIAYSIVADAAFPLKEYLMKPYPLKGITPSQRVYNYRLSRARRVIENAFGVLANRWRVFLTTIKLHPDKVITIVEACICLHNMMITGKGESFLYGISRK